MDENQTTEPKIEKFVINTNQTLKKLVFDKYQSILKLYKEAKQFEDELRVDTIFKYIKIFHVFIDDGKQRALIVDKYDENLKGNQIYELKEVKAKDSKTLFGTRKVTKFDKLRIVENDPILDISFGYAHFVARTESGNLYAWGNNYNCQLGTHDSVDRIHPELVRFNFHEPHDSVIKFSCGFYHNLALTKNGLLYAWGRNVEKQCCNSNESKLNKTTQV